MSAKLMTSHEKELLDRKFQEMEGKATTNSWSEPADLPSALLPVPSMNETIIPEPFKPWLVDIAERFQCPLEFPAMGSIVAVAAVVGRQIGIHPRRWDDWLVVPNLWGGVIGRPGIMKSPALTEIMKPLYRLQHEAFERHQSEIKEYELKQIMRKVRKEEMERQARGAIKKGTDPATIEASLGTLPEDKEPSPRRYIVNDSTVEKLGELLNQNPRGLLLYRDELTGWLKTLDREGHENDRAFYLESWNGTGSYTYDRIGRGTIHIEAACVSILGGIQPGPLQKYLREAVKGGAGDDGMMQRFQLLVYPDFVKEFRNVDRRPYTAAKNRAFEIFRKLDNLDAQSIGADIEKETVPFLRFCAEAQEYFVNWRNDLEIKIRSDEIHPVLEAHLSKYRSLMPSLALLFHLLEVVEHGLNAPVSNRAAAMAAAWCDFLEAHARRIYHYITEPDISAAKLLGSKIKAGKLTSPFSGRDVYRNGWTGLSDPQDVVRATAILEDAFWIRSETIPAGLEGGRPAVRYYVNPRLGEKK